MLDLRQTSALLGILALLAAVFAGAGARRDILQTAIGATPPCPPGRALMPDLAYCYRVMDDCTQDNNEVGCENDDLYFSMCADEPGSNVSATESGEYYAHNIPCENHYEKNICAWFADEPTSNKCQPWSNPVATYLCGSKWFANETAP